MTAEWQATFKMFKEYISLCAEKKKEENLNPKLLCSLSHKFAKAIRTDDVRNLDPFGWRRLLQWGDIHSTIWRPGPVLHLTWWLDEIHGISKHYMSFSHYLFSPRVFQNIEGASLHAFFDADMSQQPCTPLNWGFLDACLRGRYFQITTKIYCPAPTTCRKGDACSARSSPSPCWSVVYCFYSKSEICLPAKV